MNRARFVNTGTVGLAAAQLAMFGCAIGRK